MDNIRIYLETCYTMCPWKSPSPWEHFLAFTSILLLLQAKGN